MGEESETTVNRDWIMKRLCWSLQALASPPETQHKVYPDFVCVPDELAEDFENFCAAAIDNFGMEMTKDQRMALAAIDARLSAMSKDGPDFSEKLWEPEALGSEPMWQSLRELGKSALKAFRWPANPPGQNPDTFVGGYGTSAERKDDRE